MTKHNETKRAKIAVVRSVTAKLHAAEAAVDEAIKKLAELASELPTARSEIGISATVGHDAFEHIASAYSALVAGRGQTVAAHETLAEIQKAMGINVTAGGDLWKWLQHNDQMPLALVTDEAA